MRAELKVLAGFPSTTVWILSVPLKDVCAKACSGAWHCRVVMDTGKPALVRSVGFCLVGGWWEHGLSLSLCLLPPGPDVTISVPSHCHPPTMAASPQVQTSEANKAQSEASETLGHNKHALFVKWLSRAFCYRRWARPLYNSEIIIKVYKTTHVLWFWPWHRVFFNLCFY